MSWKVPLFEPDFGPDELEAVQRPIRDGWVAMGPIAQELEREFGGRCGSKHAIAVSSCTAALHLALAAAEVRPGDEVICPALTFVATANAIRYVGATPVFCESVGADNLNAGVEEIAEKISPRTTAVIVVHYAGFPVDLPAIRDLAGKRDLALIEDCAHALFSSVQRRVCGTWGLCGAFSFFSNKNMTCGEGGMLTTDSDEVASSVRRLRSHGMTSGTFERYGRRAAGYDVLGLGHNYRLDDIRASLALAQLRRLERFLTERERLRDMYCERLERTDVVVPRFDWERIRGPEDSVGYHIMPVILPEGSNRGAVVEGLREKGIQTSIHYPPVHTLSAFADVVPPSARPARTEALAERELTLPFYPRMTDEQVELVCETLLETLVRA